jgi:sterol 24-C-methyltransferase
MPQAMARHEHYMAHCLNLTSGMTVLDVGCGIGGPAKEIATFVDCKVVGLNINDYQIEKGREIAKAEDVGEEIMELVKGDFMVSPAVVTKQSKREHGCNRRRRPFPTRTTHSMPYTP